jgi:DNA-binding NarL/FixJ family response regulator
MRILLVDDNRLLLEGLTSLLTAHGLEVVADAADGFEAVARARVHRPDVVLMDVRMPRCDGIAATRLIKAEMPDIRIVMLTTSDDDEDLFEAIRSGACGYLQKNVSGDELIESLAGLEQGVPPLSPGLAAKVLQEFARRSAGPSRLPDRRLGGEDPGSTPRSPQVVAGGRAGRAVLTQRQEEVLRLVATGHTYKEVAVELGLSERTIRYHMAEIMDRLHVEHRSQVLAYAGEIGLVDRRG